MSSTQTPICCATNSDSICTKPYTASRGLGAHLKSAVSGCQTPSETHGLRGQLPASDFDISLVVSSTITVARHQGAIFELERISKSTALRNSPGRLTLNDDAVLIKIPGLTVVIA